MRISIWRTATILAFMAICLFPFRDGMADERSRLSVGVTVPVIQAMELRPPSFIFPRISSSNLDKGFVESRGAAIITVSSNVAWQLTVRSEDLDMGKVGNRIKPLSDFLWKKSGDAHYTAISHEGRLVDSSARYADHREVEVDYRMVVGWTRDKPGTYGLTLRFTMSTLE